MDIIKTLKEIQYIKLEIKYLEGKLIEKKSSMTGVKSATNTEIAAGSHVSNPSNQMTEQIIAIEELEDRISVKMAKVKELENQVDEQIACLDPKERTVVKLYYCEGETLEYICGVVNYSFRHTKRIHREALKKLKDVPKCPQMSL